MKRGLNTRIYVMYVMALLPLVLFGFYKNGLRLYISDYVDFLPMFTPLVLLFLALLGGIAGAVLREWHRDKKVSAKTLLKCKGDFVESILISCILPIHTNWIAVTVIPLLSSLLLNKVKFNRIALMYLAIEGVNVVLGTNSFYNPYEASTVLNYDGLDFFLGMGPGGIFSTSILFVTVGVLFLSFNKLYKRELVFSSLGTLGILAVVVSMLKGAYTEIFPFLFGYNILFTLVFIAPNVVSSCYTEKGQILSGVFIGILAYALSFVTPYTAAILAVFIVSLTSGVIDRIFVIK